MILMKRTDFKVGTRDYDVLIAHSPETANFGTSLSVFRLEHQCFHPYNTGVNKKKKKEKKPMMIVMKITVIQICILEWCNTMCLLKVKKA